jgi:type I restriction enzyme S subunit
MENKLPKGWVLRKMLDVVDYEGGSQPPKKQFIYSPKKGYVRLLQIRDFGKNPFPTFVPDSKRLKKAKEDDILIARYGGSSSDQDSLGRVCTGLSGAYNVALAKLIFSDKELNRKYVQFLFMEPWFRNAVSKNSRSCQTGFNRDELKDINFPIAPLEDQRRIADRLEILLAKVKDAQSRLDKIPQILKRFRQSILSAAFSGELTKAWRRKNKCNNVKSILKRSEYEISNEFELNDLPDTWIWDALGNYADCSRGRFSVRPRNDPRYYSGQYPFIQIGDLPREGGYINSHSQTLNDLGIGVSKMFPKGTVAIAIVGATIANTGILGYDMCFPDSMVGIETGNKVRNRYIEFFLRYKKDDIRQEAYAGGGQPNIKLET